MPSRQKQTRQGRVTTEGYSAASRSTQTQKPGKQITRTTRGAQRATQPDDEGITITFTVKIDGAC